MSESANLQFDRAESGAAGHAPSACVLCKQPLTTTYFDVNGKPVCPGCRTRLDTQLNAGTPASRFLKALGLGAAAAAIGAGIYYAIAALTGYELGIVAIVVGLLVGKAVQRGSNGRGGWRYQALAMALTYCALAAAYAPWIPSDQYGQAGTPIQILAAPIQSAFRSPIGFILIAIALYEAWKLNGRRKYTITGPYQVAAPTAGTA